MALRFPAGFLWGVATSSFQTEGATGKDGRADSIWDEFARTPGRILDGSTPLVTCDHYHRWREDIEAMRWLGIGAYRFSIAWPRVIPSGRGAVNARGLDFYDQLVDALLAAGIRPLVTLYHWDLPQALQASGGWAERDTVDAFVEYVDVVARRLGDRVPYWVTHNEPWCVAHLGHEIGEHAPGHRDPAMSLRVAHHLLLSHGRAVPVLRQHSRGEVGIALSLSPAWPATDREDDAEASRRFDGDFNRWYLDPLFRGSYPTTAVAERARRGHLDAGAMPFVRPGDLEEIATPLDFLGVNYYGRTVVRAAPDGVPVAVRGAPESELTDMGWEVYPHGLRDLLIRITQDYHPRRIFVTENGAAYADGPDAAEQIADLRRVEYLHRHLLAAREAIEAGVPLAGYFVWSLLDNFEWAHGFSKRFGLYWVDFANGRRLPKESAFWYRNLVAANAIVDSLQLDTPRRIP